MVADLLRVQAAFFLANPFIALGHALLVRRLDFKRQSRIDLAAAAISAVTALSCAYAGLGVWTLVAAPGALWFSRAAGYFIAAKLWQIRPRFRFEGAGVMLRYGTAMVAVQFCWFVQSQSDVFIGGRSLDAHMLGIYTTALFLTQILAAKFVPPLNEVAFAAYSRIQARPDMIQSAFLKSIRLIMLVAMPFYFGLAVTAEPLVTTFLGGKWSETVRLVPILCAAMPLMTLQILFAPATNALGRPGLAVRTGLVGVLVMPAAFAFGISWGPQGLAWAWLGGMGALLAVTIEMSRPVLGISRRGLFAAVAPGLFAAAAMAGVVAGLDLAAARHRHRQEAGLAGRRGRRGLCRLPHRLRPADRRRGGRADPQSKPSPDALDVGEHGGGLRLDLVHPELDQIADRDEADQRLALDHRQMADAAPGHQRQRAHDLRIGRHRDRRRGHDPLDRPVEHRGAVAPQAIDDVALRHDAGDAARREAPAARRSCARRARRPRRAPGCRSGW